MRVVAIAAIITSLAVPAFAQEGDSSKAEANKAEERKKKESEEINKDRLKATSREQSAKKTDPWGNLR
jgi:Tfp pilus assembly protein FimT